MTHSNLANIFHSLQFAKRLLALLVALAVFAAIETDADAQELATWDGGASDGNWASSANWVSFTPGGNDLNFAGTNRLTTTNNLGGSTNTNATITFATNAGAFIFNGASTSLNGAGFANQTVLLNRSTNIQTVNIGLNFVGNGHRIDTASNSIILNGFLAGTNIVKLGASTLFLNGTNTFTGILTHRAGVIRVANNNGLGTTAGGTVISNGAALELTTNSAGGNLSIGNEALTINGAGISSGGALRNISGNNTYQGTITNLTASRINSDADLLTLSGAINANGLALTFGGVGNIAVSGVITNSASTLTKDGVGTLTLSASNNYSGATTIGAGVLRAASSNALGTVAGGVTVSNNAALELSGSISIGAEALSIAGPGISAGGALRNVSGDNTYGGLITLTNAARINSDAGTLTLTNTGTITGPTFGLTLGGAGNIVLNSVIGTTSGTLTKDGAGTVTLGNAANTYGGVTTIGGGVLRVGTLAAAGANSSIGTNGTVIITNGGVLDYTGATTTNSRGINLASDNGGIGVSSNAAALTISGVISNSGSLVKSGAGTLILSASNTYTGTTTISNGTLLLSGSGTISTNGLDLAASGATLNISNITATNLSLAYLSGASGSAVSLGAKNMLFGGNNSSTTFAGVVSGSGNLTKTGTGTTTLSGANTYTGSAVVSVGTLNLANTTGQFHIQPCSFAGTLAQFGARGPDGCVGLDDGTLDVGLRYDFGTNQPNNARNEGINVTQDQTQARGRQLISAADRTNLYAQIEHDINDSVEAFGELLWYRAETASNRATQPLDSGLAFLIVPRTNYWNPFGPVGSPNRIPGLTTATVPTTGLDVLIEQWRPVELGARGILTDT
jgi:autotransporter-associated beta strand protein